MKKLLLITILCFAFTTNAQLREVYGVNYWGNTGGAPASFYEFDSKMFFAGGNFSSTERSLFKADGTIAGIQTINASNFAVFNNFPSVSYNEFNSELYFDGIEGRTGTEMKIFKVLSSTSQPIEVFNMTSLTGSVDSRFVNPAYLNNKIIFSPLAVSGGVGVEPYVIDLSNSVNNGVLIDINSGSSSSDPRYFISFNNEIFFSATDVANGREVWKTNGTTAGTTLFANINFGNGNSDPDQYTVLGSNMIFVATNAVTGRELFITDGTAAGTAILKNINPSAGDANPTNLIKIGSEIYFSADNGTDGQELWKTDGTEAGTVMIKNINPSGDSSPNEFTQIGNTVYFNANNGTANGHELWKTDGTEVGTVMVKDIKTNGNGNSNSKFLRVYNNKLYFLAQGNDNIYNLWVSDGTDAGTLAITSAINSGAAASKDIFIFDNELYFYYRKQSIYGLSLWAYKDPALSLSVNDIALENKISLFPNPTSNYFEIESKEALSKVEICSLQGQAIKSFTPQNQYNISELSSGVYLIKIYTEKGVASKQFIKQNNH